MRQDNLFKKLWRNLRGRRTQEPSANRRRGLRDLSHQSGRSMVEMLGVLAIMGVLTVGAMLGYRYAMDRILTNAIITGVRARSVIIGQQRVLGQPLNLSEFHPDTEKDLIYGRFEVKAFNNYVYDGEESQAMAVYNIPRRVCENIRVLTFPDEAITLVNGSEMGECVADGERENTGSIHDGGDYFTAEYHNVVTFIFTGLGDPCSGNQDCQEGLCCVALEGGAYGCLPCRDPNECNQCQTWNGTTCVDKTEGSQCLLTATAYGCCASGSCGACPDKCVGNTCDRLCQTCDSETGDCVNKDDGTDCGTCFTCQNGSCEKDMTLPGCGTPVPPGDDDDDDDDDDDTGCKDTDCPGGTCCCADETCSADCCKTQCSNDDACGSCERCKDGACVSDTTLPGCGSKCTTDDECANGTCCCADGTCSADCCGTKCSTDDECADGTCCCADETCSADCCKTQCSNDNECGSCEKCENKACVADLGQDGQTCGSEECSVCANGTCQNKMTQRTLCNGTKENCCPLNGKTCEDETGCCDANNPCNKENCETCDNGKCIRSVKTVTDCDGEVRECCSADETCKNADCQDCQVCTYTKPNTTKEDGKETHCMANLNCTSGKCPKEYVQTIFVCYESADGCSCTKTGTLTGCIKNKIKE